MRVLEHTDLSRTRVNCRTGVSGSVSGTSSANSLMLGCHADVESRSATTASRSDIRGTVTESMLPEILSGHMSEGCCSSDSLRAFRYTSARVA